MDRTNAERQRRYIARLKAQAGAADAGAVAKLEARVRELQAELARERSRRPAAGRTKLLHGQSTAKRARVAAQQLEARVAELETELAGHKAALAAEYQRRKAAEAKLAELAKPAARLTGDEKDKRIARLEAELKKVPIDLAAKDRLIHRLRVEKGIPQQDFNKLLFAFSPDHKPDWAQKNEAYRILVEYGKRLGLAHKPRERSPFDPPPMPKTREELDAARAQVRAENSARAKRAAATRAARKSADGGPGERKPELDERVHIGGKHGR